MSYTDILYTKVDGIATITINRPKAYNASRPTPAKRSSAPSRTPTLTAAWAWWC